MSAITELTKLLTSLKPHLLEPEFVFCTVAGSLADYVALEPVAMFVEAEGVTLVLKKERAQQVGLAFEGSFRQITLTVHSSLEAVGLTAAVSSTLAEQGISANVIAAYYHDHIFVPANKAQQALLALQALSCA
ncbi:ACT domain-containing protein [Oceanisphaera avium]|uniref:Transporter n=1 Tax=Oceanisphaera avium TaxID=1903694 RepID=A0A1Y0CYU9_9GAMM|nr:ACT domain-containing protein [Oceanisphaera avium]ART80005.1 transporter [Oceanisphaera avium]